MSPDDYEQAFRLIDSAYRAGSGNSTWNDFAKEFGHIFPTLQTVMAGYDQQVPQAEVFASANIEQWSLDAYLSHYHKVNIYLEKSAQWRTLPDVTYWDELFTKDEILKSEFYRDFISKQGPNHEAFAGVIFREQSRFLALTCNYSTAQRPQAERAVAMLRIVGPHLQRAFELYRQMEGQRIYISTLETSFDHLKSAVFVIDEARELHFANRPAEQLLSSGELVTLTGRHLQIRDEEDQEAVATELQALSMYTPAGPPRLLKLKQLDERNHVAFLSRLVDPNEEPNLPARNTLPAPARYLLFIIDPDADTLVEDATVASALGCSPAEAALALSLLKGDDLRAHAERNGIAYNTARVQLQSLFTKTGLNSQVELVGYLNRIFGTLT